MPRFLTVLLALVLLGFPAGLAPVGLAPVGPALAGLAPAGLAQASEPSPAPSPFDTVLAAAPRGPVVIAHRGAPGLAPDNTLPSIQRAYELGADGIEFDVQMTADGQLVICHDYYVDAYSDGTGLVAEKTLAELRELDFGSWFGPKFAGTRILTLAEALEASADFGIIDVELKAPIDRNPAYVPLVAKAIEDSGLGEKVVVSSFDHELLREFKACAPDVEVAALMLPSLVGQIAPYVSDLIPTDRPLRDLTMRDVKSPGLMVLLASLGLGGNDPEAFLMELAQRADAIYPGVTWDEFAEILDRQSDPAAYVDGLGFKVDYLFCHYIQAMQYEDLVADMHGLGVDVYVWTPTTQTELEYALETDPDGIITEDVALCRELGRAS